MVIAREAVVLVLLASCGRVGFEAGDARPEPGPPCESGHDEDGDGVADACDVCPIDVDPAQDDRDGDGVGDACDPHVDVAGDTIADFDPFTDQRAVWTVQNASLVTWGPDSVTFDSRTSYVFLDRPLAIDRDSFVMTGRVTGSMPGENQIAILDGPNDATYLYCELYETETFPGKFQLTTSEDGSSFDGHGTVLLDAPLSTPRSFRLGMSRDGTRAGCTANLPVEGTTLAADIGPGYGGEALSLFSLGLLVEVDAFVHYRSP